MTARALARGLRVVAVDAAPRMVELLQRITRAPTRVRSADALDLPDGSVDLVVASFLIHMCRGRRPRWTKPSEFSSVAGASC